MIGLGPALVLASLEVVSNAGSRPGSSRMGAFVFNDPKARRSPMNSSGDTSISYQKGLLDWSKTPVLRGTGQGEANTSVRGLQGVGDGVAVSADITRGS